MTHTSLIIDLGGTKCAAAVINQDNPYDIQAFADTFLVDHSSLNSMIDALESKLQFNFHQAQNILIAAAGIYDGECLQLANPYPFEISLAKAQRQRQWHNLRVVHDYVPLLCTSLLPDHIRQKYSHVIRPGQINIAGRRLALGIGTGVGGKDGALLPNGEFWFGDNEIGHIGISSPPSVEQSSLTYHQEFMRFLQKSNTTVTFENILAGKGLVRMFNFLYPERSSDSPSEVGLALSSGHANELLALFAWYLGLFTANCELCFMPSGGIIFGGGVLQKHSYVFEQADFTAGLQACNAYQNERQQFPLSLCLDNTLLFLGGAYLTKTI